MELAVLNDAVTESEELLAFVPAQLSDALGCSGAGIQEFLDVVELVYLTEPQEVAAGANLLLEVGNRHQVRLLQFHHADFTERIGEPKQTHTVALVMDVEQGFHHEVGKPDRVFILFPHTEITVVADKKSYLPERIRFFLLPVHVRCAAVLLGFVAYLLHGAPPQPGLAVNLSQLLDTLGIDHLVLDIAQQSGNPADALPFFSERIHLGKQLLRHPDNEILFLQVAVDVHVQNVAVRIILDKHLPLSIFWNSPFVLFLQLFFRQFSQTERQFPDGDGEPFLYGQCAVFHNCLETGSVGTAFG